MANHYYKTKCDFSEEDAPWKFSTLIEFKMANNRHLEEIATEHQDNSHTAIF